MSIDMYRRAQRCFYDPYDDEHNHGIIRISRTNE